MCNYQGYEFGASYPDSVCMDGRLFDADNCDAQGGLYEPGEEIPCPMCKRDEAVKWWTERMGCSSKWWTDGRRGGDMSYSERRKEAAALVADIRKNRKNGTEPWKVAG